MKAEDTQMTLRDHFAGLAMQGLLSYLGPYVDDSHCGIEKEDRRRELIALKTADIAAYAYAQANLMMEERNK